MDELRNWMILSRTPGLDAGACSLLLEQFGSTTALVAANSTALTAAGLNAAQIKTIRECDANQIASDLRWLEQTGIVYLPFNDSRYPSLLRQLSGAPLGLFVRGQVECLALPQLAIVGSRNPTAAGREC